MVFVDRAAERRADADWLRQAWTGARMVVVNARGAVAVADHEPLDVSAAAADRLPGRVDSNWPDRLFLGLVDQRAWFAVVVDAGCQPPAGARWVSGRDLDPATGPATMGAISAAVALVAWHAGSRFCARCGAATIPGHAGWARRCSREGDEVFPRIDPAVIMLVHDGGDRCVLGRQASWAPGRFSVLAGFVEAGETIEAAVAREVAEEVDLEVTDVRYVASQPWPYPRSLMVGCTARVTGHDLRLRDGELAEAYWFSRQQVGAAANWGEEVATAGRAVSRLAALPPPVSIARQLLDSWVQGRLTC